MSRRDLILQEIGLKPQWTRRTLLAEAALAPAAASEVKQAPAPVPEIAAPPPRQAIVIATLANEPDKTVNPAPVANDDRAAAIAAMDWETLQQAVKDCRACRLCESRTQTVFSAGQPTASLMIIGEAPGADEDRLGEPFVGQAGKLLDSMLASIDKSRLENVYIANTLKCRPPQNRNPQPEELALCTPFLRRQIALVAPKALFAVGKFAIQSLLDRTDPIKNLRGQSHDYQGTPVVVSYHPAYLLRNPPDKIKAWEDLLRVKHLLPLTESKG